MRLMDHAPGRTWMWPLLCAGALMACTTEAGSMAVDADDAIGVRDTGPTDVAADSAQAADAAPDAGGDTAAVDSVGEDSTRSDTLSADTDVADTTIADTRPGDTAGAQDTVAADTGSADTTPAGDTTPNGCPTAVITTASLTVAPPTQVPLSGASSHGGTGTITQYHWSLVSFPRGYVGGLTPNGQTVTPSLDATLGGTYVLSLDVVDSSGTTSCTPAEVTIEAVPSALLHFELVWNDNTSSASVGADLDLHVKDTLAVGEDLNNDRALDGWFDLERDVFWANPAPSWSDAAPDPAPVMLRRDDAAYGPEVVAIPTPDANATYDIGFHVWSDEDAVYLAPTEIRIWFQGRLFNRPTFSVPVAARSFWHVMSIRGDGTGLAFPFDKLSSDYEAPMSK